MTVDKDNFLSIGDGSMGGARGRDGGTGGARGWKGLFRDCCLRHVYYHIYNSVRPAETWKSWGMDLVRQTEPVRCDALKDITVRSSCESSMLIRRTVTDKLPFPLSAPPFHVIRKDESKCSWNGCIKSWRVYFIFIVRIKKKKSYRSFLFFSLISEFCWNTRQVYIINTNTISIFVASSFFCVFFPSIFSSPFLLSVIIKNLLRFNIYANLIS